MPKTKLGQIALGANLLFVLLFATKVLAQFGLPSFVIFGIGFVAIALSVVAFVRKERSVLFIVVGALIAVFVLFFVGAELLFPH